jgi:hypothetical protein
MLQFEDHLFSSSPGVILTVAAFQAERRILRVPGQGFGDAPRETPHPAEERRVFGMTPSTRTPKIQTAPPPWWSIALPGLPLRL